MRKPVLLLTATIHCGDTPFVKRQAPEVREADYKWAIRGWMEVDGYDTMVFCENSGADLSNLERYAQSINKHKHKLIFLSCRMNAGSEVRGKGHGEMEIIRHAIDTTPEIAPEQMLLKVTGRYRARNAELLLSRLTSTRAEIVCGIESNLTYSDSRLFAITPRCARKHLLPRQNEINDLEDRCFEHALSNAVHGTILAGGRWSPLPCYPSLYGFSGSAGTRFGFSLVPRIKFAVKHYLAGRIY